MKNRQLSCVIGFIMIIGFASCDKGTCYQCEHVARYNISARVEIVEVNVCNGNVTTIDRWDNANTNKLNDRTGSACKYREDLEGGGFNCIDQ